MAVTSQLEEARKLHGESVQEMEDWDAKYQALPDDTDPKEEEFTRQCFEGAREKARRMAATVERLQAIEEARKAIPDPTSNNDDNPETNGQQEARARIGVGKEPLTYRSGGQHSFFADLYHRYQGDPEAARRLDKHQQEMRVERREEFRDVTSSDPGAAGFIPPLYLSELRVEFPRNKRPFADAVPKIPLPSTGMTMSVPGVQTGASVAVQATEDATVSETDIDTQTLSISLVQIAGQNDISRVSMERSQPGMDEIIFRDLTNAYDALLDTQMLSGTAANGQHRGIRQVSGITTVTYTDTTPTAAELVPKVYDAIQSLPTNAVGPANAIVIHPRRAAWLASNLSSTFPLFQLGALNQASGTQDNGFVNNFAGLRIIMDANVGTTFGASTNEDEIYIVDLSELYLAEGPLATRVFEDVGSGNLRVRLQVYANSFFVSLRQPKAIAKIAGTGLVSPTF